MKAKSIQYQVKFDGETFTRKSPKVYTHAVRLTIIYDDGEIVKSRPEFCGSLELAQKRQASNSHNGYMIKGYSRHDNWTYGQNIESYSREIQPVEIIG